MTGREFSRLRRCSRCVALSRAERPRRRAQAGGATPLKFGPTFAQPMAASGGASTIWGARLDEKKMADNGIASSSVGRERIATDRAR